MVEDAPINRFALRAIVAALTLLLLAQVIGGEMLAHWQAQGDAMAQPNPAAVRLLAP